MHSVAGWHTMLSSCIFRMSAMSLNFSVISKSDFPYVQYMYEEWKLGLPLSVWLIIKLNIPPIIHEQRFLICTQGHNLGLAFF
jgi:hypothetical protein